MSKRMRAAIVQILYEQPGLSGFQLHQELTRRSPRVQRLKRWIGEHWIIPALFELNTGTMYIALADLEQARVITSWWGDHSPGSPHRRRHYRLTFEAETALTDLAMIESKP